MYTATATGSTQKSSIEERYLPPLPSTGLTQSLSTGGRGDLLPLSSQGEGSEIESKDVQQEDEV